jgi:uncharacterized protein (DUF488 family)
MYYRRKILLALLEIFDNELEKISFQKLLLLYSHMQQQPNYHFVPYKFGCFSFQSNADLKTMEKYNQVVESSNSWKKTDVKKYIPELKEHDRKTLWNLKRLYGGKSKDELIYITYTKFPYFAINSSIAKEVLNKTEYSSVLLSKPQHNKTILFTIGYEGISLEEYLNKLIINGVRVLCDVRKNSLSMKYGFSKNQLQNACTGVGIKYIHTPDLGIESDKRQELNTQRDYDQLFLTYRNEVLTSTKNQQQELFVLLIKHERIALTCFEANICQCHRKHLADSIAKLPNFKYEVKHI